MQIMTIHFYLTVFNWIEYHKQRLISKYIALCIASNNSLKLQYAKAFLCKENINDIEYDLLMIPEHEERTQSIQFKFKSQLVKWNIFLRNWYF